MVGHLGVWRVSQAPMQIDEIYGCQYWDYQMDIIKYIASFLFLLMIPPGLMFSTLVYWIYCYFGGYSFFEDEYAMTEKEVEEIENMIRNWLNEKKRYR